MRKVINISLYVVIFLLVALINVISIKKYFDYREKCRQVEDIIATNYIVELVSFNKIEAEEVMIEPINVELIEEEEEPIVEIVETPQEPIEEVIEIPKEQVVEEVKDPDVEIQESEEVVIPDVLFDGLNETELVAKLERSLKNELSGTGVKFVDYYKSTGLDPYLAVAIVLHETGCTWTCSSLVRECYNFGGIKAGGPTYKDTRYTCYASKEEGINSYLNMLYKNYYAKGLTTAELINPNYASSLQWAVSVNNYINKIKNN